MMKLASKPINPTTTSDDDEEFDKIMNDHNLSLLPDSKLYKADVGKPAWDLVYKVTYWEKVKLPKVANQDLE